MFFGASFVVDLGSVALSWAEVFDSVRCLPLFESLQSARGQVMIKVIGAAPISRLAGPAQIAARFLDGVGKWQSGSSQDE